MAIKLKLRSNFSFLSLSNNIEDIVKSQSLRSTKNFAESARQKISRGLAPPLKSSTKEIRKSRGTGGSKPLYETGSLFRSIKATENGLEMNKYGIYHQEGYITSPRSMIANKVVPARPFVFPSDKEVLEIQRRIATDIYRAMRANKIIK